MQLSQRLLAVADLASAGHCLADVGTCLLYTSDAADE